MRRCKDIVQVARRYVTYRIFIRSLGSAGQNWANARSILNLQALQIPGPQKGEPMPMVEVKVSGLHPEPVMQAIKNVLQAEPKKYLNIYELYQEAQNMLK
jgi:phosphotransferase system HPr-like phosphotransfer protein